MAEYYITWRMCGNSKVLEKMIATEAESDISIHVVRFMFTLHVAIFCVT